MKEGGYNLFAPPVLSLLGFSAVISVWNEWDT